MAQHDRNALSRAQENLQLAEKVMTARKALATLGLAVVVAAVAAIGAAQAQGAPTLRFAVIGSGGQSEVPFAIQQAGLDKKYGIKIEIIDFAAPGQQYNMFRSGAADIASGNFIDLLRQRKGGNAIQAIHGFQGYNNVFVVKPNSPFKEFADLKGRKVGTFGTTFLDWLIVRAAGKKAFDVDLETDASLVPGAPPLLNQFLARGEVDATLQFSSLALAPIVRNEQRMLIDLPALMKAAGLRSDLLYLQWMITEKWAKANPEAVSKLPAMLNEAYALLKRDDGLWPVLAQRINITDPAIIAAYRDLARRIDNPPYSAELIKPTQELLDALVAIAGEPAVGVTTVDPAAFLFP
jgi:NitT/TauT family transport system substrate-binding protein